MVVIVDDEDRENKGDLAIAAEMITPEAINFMATHARGLICLTITGERADELELAPMTPRNTSPCGTAFTVSIDARGRGVTTGISAYDRAQTILAAIDPSTRPEDLGRPGHVFPLRARTWRSFGTSRTDRSKRRPGSSRRTKSLGSDLRNYERRRQYGAARVTSGISV